MGYEYLAKTKNDSVNQSKSNSLIENYHSEAAPHTNRTNAYHNAVQPVRQFKSLDKCEGSNVIQLNIAAYQNTHRVNFQHARNAATGEYQRLGNANAAIGQQQLAALNIDMEMPEYRNHLAQLPPIPGINPEGAGNHLFNAIGDSMWNFYDGLFQNISNDILYRNWQRNQQFFVNLHIAEVNINTVWYGGLQVLCETYGQLRDVATLRYFGAVNSNNHITYSLYSTKYFYDCLKFIDNAMNYGVVGVMPAFDEDQAIDQPAVDARDAQVRDARVIERAVGTDYDNAFNECTAQRTNLIELFEEAILSLANYLARIAHEWFE